jgi:hypothetical protein
MNKKTATPEMSIEQAMVDYKRLSYSDKKYFIFAAKLQHIKYVKL